MTSGESPDLPVAVRTLVAGGFVLDAAERNPGYALLHMHRVDEFGAVHSYSFAIAEKRLHPAQVAAAQIASGHKRSRLVLIGEADGTELPAVEWDRFLNLFGGPVFGASPFDPQFRGQIALLGTNQVPDGLVGKADDLFEAYVRDALEFILGGRVIRYGQDRRFEARPDGIALPGHNFCALYDAKAYRDGYPVSAESIRQFKSYVEDFEKRYRAYLPRVNAFIVISGDFVQGGDALGDRSRELQAECGVPLVFLRANDLGEIVAMVAERPAVRRSIDWRRIFADPIISTSRVRKDMDAVLRDRIVPGS